MPSSLASFGCGRDNKRFVRRATEYLPMARTWDAGNESCMSPPAGTVISDAQSDVDRTGTVMVKGFATIDNVALINVEGTGEHPLCLRTPLAAHGWGRKAHLDKPRRLQCCLGFAAQLCHTNADCISWVRAFYCLECVWCRCTTCIVLHSC